MKRRMLSFLSFVATVVSLLLVLTVMNWLPTVIDQRSMRRYPDIESVSAKLDIGKVYVPSYFPETLAWPPVQILAQGKPFAVVVMEFERLGDGETALLISQAARQDFMPDTKISFLEITEKVRYDLKGREAVLEAGLCKDRSSCSRISWAENGTFITLTMRAHPLELLRVSESML